MADHDGRRDVALRQRPRRNSGVGDAGPHRAIGKSPNPGGRRSRAHERTRAGSVDHEVESRRKRSFVVDRPRAAVRRDRDVDDGAAGLDRRPASGEGLPENGVQRRAVNADGVEGGIEIGVAQIEHDAAALVEAVQPADRGAARLDGVAQAQPFERGEPGRLQHQPGADRLRGGEALVDRDAMAPARQHRRRGEPADAGADDRNIEASPHAADPPGLFQPSRPAR